MIDAQTFFDPKKKTELLVEKNQFFNWTCINDSIMGGNSKAFCSTDTSGLTLKGDVIERDGGFVSCSSQLFDPPLNLASYSGFRLEVDGDGRTLKFAVACRDGLLGITELFQGGVRWVSELPTKDTGTTFIDIPFSTLKPNIRAKSIPYPLTFNETKVTQFQLLHSKFGLSGDLNTGFRTGPIQITLRSISGIV